MEKKTQYDKARIIKLDVHVRQNAGAKSSLNCNFASQNKLYFIHLIFRKTTKISIIRFSPILKKVYKKKVLPD
jgi:hypothetical protein